MDSFAGPNAASLAEARRHVQALADCGLSKEALLRALLEDYDAEGISLSPAQTTHSDFGNDVGFVQMPDFKTGHGGRDTHLSISTLSSGSRMSSARASMMSQNTALTSISSHTAMSSRDLPPVPLKKASSFYHSSGPVPRAVSMSSISTVSGSTRAYWCSFCETKFQRKFDWKRHEDEFHERWKKYPCDQCNRVFWGFNSFNQHHRTTHGCTTCPHADRVIRYTKRKRAWGCGFCAGLKSSRDGWIDHVATHYEAGCTKAHWNHSNVIYGLLHQPFVHEAWKQLHESLYGHLPKDQRPLFEWDVETTGHAQGFLENESPGRLQDLLEFFSGSRDDPALLARLAHDQATIIYRHKKAQDPQEQESLVSAIASATAAASGTVATATAVTMQRPISEPPRPTAVALRDKRTPAKRHFSAPHLGPVMDGLRTGLRSIVGQQSRAQRLFGRSQSHNSAHRCNLAPPAYSTASSPLSPSASTPIPASTDQILADSRFPASQMDLDQPRGIMHSLNSMQGLFPQTILETPEHEFSMDMTQFAPSELPAVIPVELEGDGMVAELSAAANVNNSGVPMNMTSHGTASMGGFPGVDRNLAPSSQLTVPAPFEDWSSFTTTVVDDGFTAVPSPAPGWQGGMAGTNMPHGHGS